MGYRRELVAAFKAGVQSSRQTLLISDEAAQYSLGYIIEDMLRPKTRTAFARESLLGLSCVAGMVFGCLPQIRRS